MNEKNIEALGIMIEIHKTDMQNKLLTGSKSHNLSITWDIDLTVFTDEHKKKLEGLGLVESREKEGFITYTYPNK